jgi:RNA polymerase sigma factor (sigma-70 family)
MWPLTKYSQNLGLSQQEYEQLVSEAQNPFSKHYQKLWYAIYSKNFDRLERLFVNTVSKGEAAFASDIVQDAFIKFSERVATPPPPEYQSLTAFVMRIARNIWVNPRSKAKKGYFVTDEYDGQTHDEPENWAEMQEAVENNEALQSSYEEAVAHLLANKKLKELDWWIFQQRYLHNRKSKDIAQQLTEQNIMSESGEPFKENTINVRCKAMKLLLRETITHSNKSKN